MIRLIPAERDDIEFLSLAERIANGAISVLELSEVFLVQIENWFDHKWLGWRSPWRQKQIEELRIPTFTSNRVRSEKRFVRESETSTWKSLPLKKPLHILQPGRPWLAQPIERISKRAAFIWYSGNSATNQVGSLMFYASGAEMYAWYASLKKAEHWAIADEFGVTRSELRSFQECGANSRRSDDLLP